ncbi:MAG TPA: GNAT family N-acetyltransferase [Azospirillaceae bacterium]|nr:GNAT family N-acetyltransferase [Azospirillaceae bacterium]
MSLPDLLARPHGAGFAAAWRDAVAAEFGWRRAGPFLAVPSLGGGRTLSYLPLLNYTDLDPAGAEALAREAGGEKHLVRVLAPGTDAADGAPVAMRVLLAGRSAADLWSGVVAPVCRNRVRKAEKAGMRVRRGRDPATVDAFARLLAGTLARHGAPMLPPRLLRRLASDLGAEAFVAEAADGRPLAGLLAAPDGGLVWVPWIATDREDGGPAGDLLFWRLLEAAAADGRDLVDFGRSPFGGGTWRFKRKWGAEAVPLRLLGAEGSPYAKFALAQRVWKMLPRPVVDRAGPFLVRYLADY